jgi:hypothetical protein
MILFALTKVRRCGDRPVKLTDLKTSMRGSRLGYEVTSQTQAVQSTAVIFEDFKTELKAVRVLSE